MDTFWQSILNNIQWMGEWSGLGFWITSGLLVAILLCFLWLLYRMIRGEPQTIVAFDSPDGSITVSPKAVEEIIQKAANTTAGIARCKSKLKVKRRQLNIHIRLQLKAGNRMKRVEESLKRHIRYTMQEMLGMDNIGAISIEITGIVGNPPPPLDESEPEEPRLLSKYDEAPEVESEQPPEKKEL